jgi:hypothetical protein
MEEEKTPKEYAQLFIRNLRSESEVPDHYLSEWKISSNQEFENLVEPHPHGRFPPRIGDIDWWCDCDRYTKKHFLCVCTNHIIEYWVIQNRINGKRLLVGKDCGKKFLGLKSPENTCIVCGKYHRKNEVNMCKKCQKWENEEDTKITFGKFKGQTYIDVYRKHPDYCKWILEQDTDHYTFSKFQDWILWQMQTEED